MAAAHTPGPWVFDLEEGEIQHAESGMCIATVSAPEDFPCRDTDKDRDFEGELIASGYLLAAAPDLLAELKALRTRFHNACGAMGSDPEFIAFTTPCADAAIAKAEGRS